MGPKREYIIPDIDDVSDDISKDLCSEESEEETETETMAADTSSEYEKTSWFSRTQNKMIWKGGGVLGAAAATLTSVITYELTQNPAYAVLSSFIPFGLGLGGVKITVDEDCLSVTMGLASFTVSAFNSSALNAFVMLSPLPENYRTVASMASFAIVASAGLAVPEICQKAAKVSEAFAKLSSSCLSFWNQKPSTQDNANENLLSEVVISERSNLSLR